MKLFPREQVAGIFRGFSEGGLEFHADLVLPYRSEFQNMPMHGQFLVVQLETENEGVLGRITSIASEGRLASAAGDDYGLRAVAENREIPEDLRDQYLKYRISMRVLGVLRLVRGKVVFAPSHRRLPHVGSKVAFLSPELLREVAGHYDKGAELGFLALGEFIYSGDDGRLKAEDWMQICQPTVCPRFDIRHLVSRRTFVFARAGFGKSNLNKLLFSTLYRETPTVTKRGGRQVPVGTVVFDPDGEYFWPDDKNRPGLCDVPELQDKLVIFTNRTPPSPYYGSFVAGDIRIDIRRLRPQDVISIALSPEKQDQQNVRKLKGLNDIAWRRLVDEIHANGNAADPELLRELLHLEASQEAELVAARANMTTIVRMLHDPRSQMLDMLLRALADGKLCVVDVSQMRGTPALVLSGLVLQRIFEHNQQEFTEADPRTIPTIAVIEEAQAVLGARDSSGEGPYVAWVKEGRKYDLGAVLITQQPGSISQEILSQGDNWFVFHLLSAADLLTLKRANAHYSDDILSSLLNEPIPGHAVVWSSASGKSYPVPVRILSFEDMHPVRDPDGTRPPEDTYAARLREEFRRSLAESRHLLGHDGPDIGEPGSTPAAGRARGGPGDEERIGDGPTAAPIDVDIEDDEDDVTDASEIYIQAALQRTRQDQELINSIRTTGVPWRRIVVAIENNLPPQVFDSDRNRIAHSRVPEFLDSVFGPQGEGWKTERRPRRDGSGGTTTWVIGTG